MPVGVRIDIPDELKAHETAPSGTVVHLNMLTNAHPFTELINEVNYWNAPYQLYKTGAWLNEAEYSAWVTAYESHRQEDARRYDRYLAEKADYEDRRRRCAAFSA